MCIVSFSSNDWRYTNLFVRTYSQEQPNTKNMKSMKTFYIHNIWTFEHSDIFELSILTSCIAMHLALTLVHWVYLLFIMFDRIFFPDLQRQSNNKKFLDKAYTMYKKIHKKLSNTLYFVYLKTSTIFTWKSARLFTAFTINNPLHLWTVNHFSSAVTAVLMYCFR